MKKLTANIWEFEKYHYSDEEVDHIWYLNGRPERLFTKHCGKFKDGEATWFIKGSMIAIPEDEYIAYRKWKDENSDSN